MKKITVPVELRNALVEVLGALVEGRDKRNMGLCDVIDTTLARYCDTNGLTVDAIYACPNLCNPAALLKRQILEFASINNVVCQYQTTYRFGIDVVYPLNSCSSEYWDAYMACSLNTTDPNSPYYAQAERRRTCAIYLLNYIGREWE